MGFFEFAVIGVIALLVFGPEKLPKVVYDVGQLVRAVRRSASSLRQEFEQSVSADIKADIHNSAVIKSLEENKIAVEQTLGSLDQSMGDLPYDVSADDASNTANKAQQPIAEPKTPSDA